MDEAGSHIRVLGLNFPVCQLEGVKLYAEETPAQVFSCDYEEIFKSTYFQEYLVTTSKILLWVFL